MAILSLVAADKCSQHIDAISDNHRDHQEGDTVTSENSEPSSMAKSEALKNSLHAVLALLGPILKEKEHDKAMSILALSQIDFIRPLTKREVHILACGLYVDVLGRNFTYADILDLTFRFQSKAMAVTLVYESIKSLIERGLVVVDGTLQHPNSDRVSKAYAITETGRQAFKLTILNAQILSEAA